MKRRSRRDFAVSAVGSGNSGANSAKDGHLKRGAGRGRIVEAEMSGTHRGIIERECAPPFEDAIADRMRELTVVQHAAPACQRTVTVLPQRLDGCRFVVSYP